MADKRIYVVVDEPYGDLRVCGVYEDRDIANQLAKHIDGDVLEWSLDLGAADIRQGHFPFRVRLYGNGDCLIDHFDFAQSWFDLDFVTEDPAALGGGVIVADVLARDEDHAKTIAFDKIAQYRARKEGLA